MAFFFLKTKPKVTIWEKTAYSKQNQSFAKPKLPCLLYTIIMIITPSRNSCAINLGDTVVITGNFDESNAGKVTEYSEDGFVKDLPELLQGRYGHACALFVNDEGMKVNTLYIKDYKILIYEKTTSLVSLANNLLKFWC